MDGQHSFRWIFRCYRHMVQRNTLTSAPSPQSALGASTLDENPSHRFGGRSEEMPSAVPALAFGTSQPKPGFVHERGRLQRLAGCFAGHLVRRQFTEFLIN